MKFLAAITTLLFCLFSNPANALHVPLPTKCLCFTGGLAVTIKERNHRSCTNICKATKRVSNNRYINRNRNYNKYISLRSNRYRANTKRDTKVHTQTQNGDQYVIAFSGINKAIDIKAAQRIAVDQQRTLKVFGFNETDKAAAFIKQTNSGHSLLGFSAGASASVINHYIYQLKRLGLSLPYTITTVGLYDFSPVYNNANIPTIHYIDHSGQRHRGQANVINLGANTSHLDSQNGAMVKVANIIEKSLSIPNIVVEKIVTIASTAIYDISTHTVYLPNGEQLEAHSGLGFARDNPRFVHVRNRGPVPPNVYQLTMRERPFYGVKALRLNPVNESLMHGRDGILAHTYLHGSNGQSQGCLAFRNYPAFLAAFQRGLINKINVVVSLTSEFALKPIDVKPIKVVAKVYHRRIQYVRYNYRHYAHNYRRRHG